MARETKAAKAEREAREAEAAQNEQLAAEGASVATVGGETAVVAENTPLSDTDKGLLASIADATKGNSFLYVQATDSAALVAAGLVETNASIIDAHGALATRATAKGMQIMADDNSNAPAADAGTGTVAAAEAPASGFVIASVPLPTRKSERAGRSSSYPFDALEVGQSFFVAATADKPNPRKSLASTVSSATRRYATKTDQTREITVKGVKKSVPVYNETRKFEVFEGTGDAYGQPGVKGAIVGRTK